MFFIFCVLIRFSDEIPMRGQTHRDAGKPKRMWFIRMPFGCPARDEHGAFESNISYGSAAFIGKSFIRNAGNPSAMDTFGLAKSEISSLTYPAKPLRAYGFYAALVLYCYRMARAVEISRIFIRYPHHSSMANGSNHDSMPALCSALAAGSGRKSSRGHCSVGPMEEAIRCTTIFITDPRWGY